MPKAPASDDRERKDYHKGRAGRPRMYERPKVAKSIAFDTAALACGAAPPACGVTVPES